MEDINIVLNDEKIDNVKAIFYTINNIYYLIFTECKLDENGYVILHVVKVGKENINGQDTFVGVEITDDQEWKTIQNSISSIVDEKKTKTPSGKIQYLPVSMLNTMTTPIIIMSEKTFRLKKEIIQKDFGVNIDPSPYEDTPTNDIQINNDNTIIDYRSKYFEEKDKITELENKISLLEDKISKIKNIIVTEE